MGFRFRKSINMGGGFRLNLSKSGVGYSWGTKGFRITKRANSKNPGCIAGCLYICGMCIVWLFKLIFWMIYGVIWLCFILPIKLIIKLCKKSHAEKEASSKEINAEKQSEERQPEASKSIEEIPDNNNTTN